MQFLKSADHYDAVRAAIDTSLTEDILPNDLIQYPIYQGAGEDTVKRNDPLWATRTGEDFQHLINAAILYTAALLAPAIPPITLEYFGDYRYRRTDIDWKLIATNLRQRADQEIAIMLQDVSIPTMFKVGCGQRGR